MSGACAIGAPVRRRRLIIIRPRLPSPAPRALTAHHAIRRAQLPEPRTPGRRPDHADHRGVGRLYGAFIGVPLYMSLEPVSEIEPVYWYFWIAFDGADRRVCPRRYPRLGRAVAAMS
jgi:hypothetical protein